jgi:hypothetical protein
MRLLTVVSTWLACSDAFRGRYVWTPAWREHHIVDADGTVRSITPHSGFIQMNELGHVASSVRGFGMPQYIRARGGMRSSMHRRFDTIVVEDRICTVTLVQIHTHTQTLNYPLNLSDTFAPHTPPTHTHTHIRTTGVSTRVLSRSAIPLRSAMPLNGSRPSCLDPSTRHTPTRSPNPVQQPALAPHAPPC